MTVIAVRVKKKTIEIAGDSQTTWGDHKMPKKNSSDKQVQSFGKIFQTNGLTLGCAGSVAHIGLLQIFSKTHAPKEMERDSILDWFIEFKEWVLDKAKINFSDILMHGIIIRDGKAFAFYDFMEVSRIYEFDAVGSGMFLAIGALELGATTEQAVNVAIKYDLYCGGSANKITIKI